MNGNAELLNFIYQNSQMGVDTIDQLLKIAEGAEFRRQLQSEFDGYTQIHIDARELLNENGYEEKEIGGFDKLKTYLMINMQTMTDKTPSHIAQMMIIGSNMGVLDAVKNLKKYSDAEKKIKNLMERLLKFEEDNVQKLKNFL